MLFSRSLLSLSTITCVVFSVVNAAPIQQQQEQQPSTYHQLYVPEAGFLLTESLSEYYENIVDQVMLDVSDQVLTTLPEIISHGDVEVRQLAQKSLNRNLNFMRASLLASVNPLVSTDIPQIAGLTTIQNEASSSKLSSSTVTEDKTQQMESILLESIMTLNKKISHQLGLIVNAEQSSSILIRQANSHPQHNNDRQEINKSTVITVEWKLRQPFQINVIREEPKTITSNVNDDMVSESEWLFNQLTAVELNLLNEFNDRTLDAIQLVMESLALDI